MDKVRKSSELPWTKLDALHRMILEDLLKQYNIALTEEEKAHWTNVWHRLSGWPDAVEGLTRLKKNYIYRVRCAEWERVAAGGDGQVCGAAAQDTVFGGEISSLQAGPGSVFGRGGIAELQAGRGDDVRGAPLVVVRRSPLGLRTGYVPRLLEGGPDRKPAPASTAETLAGFDVVAKDFVELAGKLEAMKG